MKEILKDSDFNLTIRIIVFCLLASFLIYSVKCCEIERINKCTTIKQVIFNKRNIDDSHN